MPVENSDDIGIFYVLSELQAISVFCSIVLPNHISDNGQ